MNDQNFERYLRRALKRRKRPLDYDALRCPFCRESQRTIDVKRELESHCFMCGRDFVWVFGCKQGRFGFASWDPDGKEIRG